MAESYKRVKGGGGSGGAPAGGYWMYFAFTRSDDSEQKRLEQTAASLPSVKQQDGEEPGLDGPRFFLAYVYMCVCVPSPHPCETIVTSRSHSERLHDG